MGEIQNVLFIMTDQMRFDCLGVKGHPVLKTPNLDWLAQQGVRFDKAYVQSAVCGPSRMSFYTGRYVHAHRSFWNDVPLPLDEITIGQYLQASGIRAAICGKTHFTEDYEFLERLEQTGFNKHELHAEFAGMEPWETNDMIGAGWVQYLKNRGYQLPFDTDPVRAPFIVEAPSGQRLNGWRFEACRYPTVIREEDSDTAYMTNRGIDFIREAGDQPWMLHLSYLKPHWPNVAPAPYHNLYDPATVPPPIRAESELQNAHPLIAPFREERRSLPFDNETTWREMRATYYGLIQQIDDNLGRLFKFLQSVGRFDDTLIIFTSDHGEYMGDHWLFEKELFYEQAIRVPLIIYDPSTSANATRGTVNHQFVESIDILPTCLASFELDIPRRIQGESLLPWIRGESIPKWRDAVYLDWDFRFYHSGAKLSLPLEQCRAWMIRDDQFKYAHFNGLPSMLFDLEKDPNEFCNVADHPAYKDVVSEYQRRLLVWRQSTEDNSRGSWLEMKNQRKGVDFIPDSILEME